MPQELDRGDAPRRPGGRELDRGDAPGTRQEGMPQEDLVDVN